MGLSVFLSRRVVKLKRSQTGTSHEQESDVLDIFDVFLVDVLETGDQRCIRGSDLNDKR